MLAAGLVAAAPLVMAALGEAVGEKSGLLNLGIEGMMLCGAFFGFYAAYQTGAAVWGVVAGLGAGFALGLVFAIFGGGLTAFLYRDIFGGQNPSLSVDTPPGDPSVESSPDPGSRGV